MTLLADFARVSRLHPCPMCGRQKFCLVDRASRPDPARVICTKVQSPKQWGEAGWLHVLRDDSWGKSIPRRSRQIAISGAQAVHQFDALTQRCQTALDARALDSLAASLGLTASSLHRLEIGWISQRTLLGLGTSCRGRGCWSFPMRDGKGEVVGIRLRTEGGFKYAVKGGHQGLSIPSNLTAGGPLHVAEGPTDTAALLDLGLQAVGRPSCTGGVGHLRMLVKRIRPASVVVVADADAPGRTGAAILARALAAQVRNVRTIHPPGPYKDARAWKNARPTSRPLQMRPPR